MYFYFISLAHVTGEAVIAFILAAPFAILLVILTKVISNLIKPIHPIFKIQVFRAYVQLWLIYSILIIGIVLKYFN
jgi:ABC-type arginine/histidine transport system permease subunit